MLNDQPPTRDRLSFDPKPGARATPLEDAENGCAVCGAPIDLKALKQLLAWDGEMISIVCQDCLSVPCDEEEESQASTDQHRNQDIG